MQQARAVAKQLVSENSEPLVWEADSVPQPVSEATVSNHRQQKKLTRLHLSESLPEPIPEVRVEAPT